jgi:chromosomal replication initiation ATPase DnaA
LRFVTDPFNLYKQRDTDEAEITNKVRRSFKADIDTIIQQVAEGFMVSEQSIKQSQRGRVENNVARWVAMYISRDYAGIALKEIASHFNLKRTGSIPTTIRKLGTLMEEDKELLRKVKKMKSQYDT